MRRRDFIASLVGLAGQSQTLGHSNRPRHAIGLLDDGVDPHLVRKPGNDARTEPHAGRSCGCSQTLLYNTVRPHSRLGWLAPAVYAANFLPQRGQGAALANGSAPWPNVPTVQDGNRQTLRPTG